MNVPTLKREDINMDFLVGLPQKRRRNDSTWVIVDRLKKSSHFIPIKSTYFAVDYARIYINNKVCLHGAPLFIISDRPVQLTSRFWI